MGDIIKMRKYLLPETGNFYKANLHCHTTVSDGSLDPETVKGAYMAQGYSVVAFTDHNVLIGHNDLTDNRFLALNGMEKQISEEKDVPEIANGSREQLTCHMCFIALDPDNLTQPCYNRTKYLSRKQEAAGIREKIKFDESKPDFIHEYTVDCVSAAMEEAKKCGFFVTYNHPNWSCETYEQYGYYHGMHAMEIVNYSSQSIGFEEYNPKVYDEMLRSGKRIGCVASDDNHNRRSFVSKHCDSFGGFTMIKAEALEYKAITDALLSGNYYASEGPEINELYYEDGKIYVKCSDAKKICMATGKRDSARLFAEAGKYINEADFAVLPEYNYVRITVIDEYGRHANSIAYFTDDIMKD